MVTTLKLNVPKLYVGCLDCRRETEVPSRGALPVEITVPCECARKVIERFAFLLRYASQKEPFAILPLQEGPPGWRG